MTWDTHAHRAAIQPQRRPCLCQPYIQALNSRAGVGLRSLSKLPVGRQPSVSLGLSSLARVTKKSCLGLILKNFITPSGSLPKEPSSWGRDGDQKGGRWRAPELGPTRPLLTLANCQGARAPDQNLTSRADTSVLPLQLKGILQQLGDITMRVAVGDLSPSASLRNPAEQVVITWLQMSPL